MSLPTEEQVKKTNDEITEMVYNWARRLESLAMKYKIRGEQWVKCLSYPSESGYFMIGCESVDGTREWGAYYYPENGDIRAVENCRLTVKLDFLEVAQTLENKYLQEVEAFYGRAQKIIASKEEKKELAR